jgi:hypothetical protein
MITIKRIASGDRGFATPLSFPPILPPSVANVYFYDADRLFPGMEQILPENLISV